jgi:hypothetical protein
MSLAPGHIVRPKSKATDAIASDNTIGTFGKSWCLES